MNKYFIEGSIPPEFIAAEIAKHSSKTSIGAHSIFLGQVRADDIEGKKVIAIRYTAYLEMAEKKIAEIREEILNKFDFKCLHVFHSIGRVNTGEISFFVFGSMSHRKNIYEAIEETVELIKKNVPVFKEIISI